MGEGVVGEKTPLMAGSELKKRMEDSDEQSGKKLIRASVLCGVFMVVELVGGYLSGSLAVMTDAAHLLSDLAGFLISIVAVHVGKLPGDPGMSYGYARAEVIGALFSIVFIWVLAGVLFYYAVQRLFNPQPVNGPMMFFLGLIGLLVNFVLGFVLGAESLLHGHSHDHKHSHDHGEESHDHEEHDHDHSHEDHSDVENGNSQGAKGERNKIMDFLTAKDIKSVNVRAAYIHVLGDLFQNVGVMIAAAVIWYNSSWKFMDPLCTILFMGIVIGTTTGVARDALNVLMEGTPPGFHIRNIYDSLMQVDGVSGVSDIHVWSLTIGKPALSVHLNTPFAEQHPVLKGAQKVLEDMFGVVHATIQVNCEADDCCDDTTNQNCQCVNV